MNQSQRNFLVDRIEEQVKAKKKMLEDSLPEAPSLVNYLFHKIMSNDFDIKEKDEIKQMIIEKCLSAKDGKDWASGDSHWSATKRNITFKLEDFFVIPDEYQRRFDEYHKERSNIHQEINLLNTQAETLIVRIKLASNSVLESLIREVDDMGNISLMDTKLKALTT